VKARVGDLTVLAKIRPQAEPRLRAVLDAVERDHESNGYLQLARSPSTHLANFVILDDPDNGKRLVFSANFDGPLDAYVAELLEIGPGIDEIFFNCEGYTGRANLRDFVVKNRVRPQVAFAGFPYETVGNILLMLELRTTIERFLDLPEVARFLEKPGMHALFDTVADLAPGATSLVVKAARLERFFSLVHDAFFSVVLWLARQYGTLIVTDEFRSAAANIDQTIDPALSDADHMTNLIDVSPRLLWRLYLALMLMEFLGRYAFPPGELAGVTTIHFARWVLVDGGKRMLFQSKFDGSWENYMGDFVDKVAWGLDAIWGNCVGYPPAGMRDIDAFKRFIRDRQFAHVVDYFAYPSETVLNLMRDREIASALQNFLAIPLAKTLLETL
jgi:hypothetical protein